MLRHKSLVIFTYPLHYGFALAWHYRWSKTSCTQYRNTEQIQSQFIQKPVLGSNEFFLLVIKFFVINGDLSQTVMHTITQCYFNTKIRWLALNYGLV